LSENEQIKWKALSILLTGKTLKKPSFDAPLNEI
jgi:hypothetical protein